MLFFSITMGYSVSAVLVKKMKDINVATVNFVFKFKLN